MAANQMSYLCQPPLQRHQHQTLSQLLDTRVTETPNNEAIVLYDDNRERFCLTFAEYQVQSQALAASFLERGLVRGDRVALMSPNSLEYCVSLMALWRIGANAVNVVQGLSSEEILEVISELRCVALVCYVQESDQEHREPVVQALRRILQEPADKEPSFKFSVTISEQVKPAILIYPHVYSYKDLLADGQKAMKSTLRKVEVKVQFDDDAMVLFTSGSTGIPKAVQFTHHALVNGSTTSAHSMRIRSNAHARIFNDSPFSWAPGICEGLLLACVFGATVVHIPPTVVVRDRSDFFLSVIQKEKCTHAILLSYHLFDMVELGDSLANFDLTSLKFASTGGQPVAKALLGKLLDHLPDLQLVLFYASSEFFMITDQLVHSKNIDSIPYGWMSVNPNVEIKVVDDEGLLLPVRSTGEIHVRGPGTCRMYLEDPQNTARMISRTGWLNTSDIGEMDEDGRIRILGRKGFAINRATDTFYPAEFEQAVVQHPLVSKAVMVAVPDQRLYEEMCACLILKEHLNLEEKKAELENWYDTVWPSNADGLSWKPEHTIFLEEFPTTRTNKPDRHALRKIAIEKLELESDN